MTRRIRADTVEQMPGPDPTSLAAELSAITETVTRSRDRVAALAEPFLGTERDDIVTSLYEAERQLLSATRALERALRAAR